MSNNITINIKNCGCGGGSSGSGGGATGEWIVEPPFNELGYPQLPAGPPDGYSIPPGTLADRQCKMAVWLYDWVETVVDTMANESVGAVLLSVIRAGKSIPGGTILLPLVAGVITFVLGVVLTPGVDPGDAVISVAAMIGTKTLLAALEGVATEFVTQPLLQDALPKIQSVQDDIICQLAKAPDALTAWNNYSKLLSDLDLTWEQIAIIKGLTPRWGFTVLFFSTDWWPSFDDDVLAGITTTCCGDYTDGDPITPGSVQQCQASHYIIDQLAVTLQNTSDQLEPTAAFINPAYNDVADVINELQQGVEIPTKIAERMTSQAAFFDGVARIYYDQSTVFTGTLNVDDPGFSGLADYMTTNRATLVSNLQAAADQSAAFTSLYGSLTAWIDANVTDVDYQTWMKQTIAALITPTNRDDVLDLLFLQDSDLLGYAAGECGNDSDPATYGPSTPCGIDTAAAVYDFAVSQYNWSHFAGNGTSQYTGDRFVANGNWLEDTHLYLEQNTKHSVEKVRVTFDNPYATEATGASIYVSDNKQDWTEVASFSGPGEPTFEAQICADDKYIRIRIHEFHKPRIDILKVEYIRT